MRVVVVYKIESDHAREVMSFLRDFSQRTGKALEEVDPESRDGESFCRAYDIVEYPTMIALRDDGRVQNVWRGRPLPQIDEVSYYVS